MTYFYPRPPRGGRLQCERPGKAGKKFLSTPSARRATGRRGQPDRQRQISIHALREEGDALSQSSSSIMADFYPRPPRGGRLRPEAIAAGNDLFLSTPSARRATQSNPCPPPRRGISIHALREEGDVDDFSFKGNPINFYPRPPRGGRRYKTALKLRKVEFLSTPSARRATCEPQHQRQHLPISIHALREEGDSRLRPESTRPPHFYPRPPRGGRPVDSGRVFGGTHFYPRPPRGGRP